MVDLSLSNNSGFFFCKLFARATILLNFSGFNTGLVIDPISVDSDARSWPNCFSGLGSFLSFFFPKSLKKEVPVLATFIGSNGLAFGSSTK